MWKPAFFGSVEKKGSPGGVHKHVVVVLFLMRCTANNAHAHYCPNQTAQKKNKIPSEIWELTFHDSFYVFCIVETWNLNVEAKNSQLEKNKKKEIRNDIRK